MGANRNQSKPFENKVQLHTAPNIQYKNVVENKLFCFISLCNQTNIDVDKLQRAIPSAPRTYSFTLNLSCRVVTCSLRNVFNQAAGFIKKIEYKSILGL